jgi:hypothetical protein
MSRSDSKIDLDAYKPSLEDARRIADEQAAQERLKKALDNPALDRALAEVRATAGATPARVSKPSPWAHGATPGAETVDKAALPSANAPAAPPVTAPVQTKPANARRPRTWSASSKALAAIALAFVPAMIVFLLFVKPQTPSTPQHPAPATSAAASSQTMSVPPRATTGPSALPDASTTPATSAAPTSAPSGAPVPAPGAPAGAQPRLKPRAPIDDPYDAAPATPSPPKSAEPVAPPAPPPPTPPAPTSTTPFEGKPVF